MKNAATVRFVVTDTGIGIDPSFLPRIFDAFTQESGGTTAMYGGTGLGLAISKSIVDMMDGHITVRSIQGVGSEFTVDVKLEMGAEETHRRREAIPYAEMKCLVVDDDVAVCQNTVQILREIGMDYEMAQVLHENIEANGVHLSLGDGVDSFRDDGKQVTIVLKSGKEIAVELVVLSIGVRPNNELAKAAGLPLNARGGVVTDEHLRTSDPNIYAVGDIIEVNDLVFGERTMNEETGRLSPSILPTGHRMSSTCLTKAGAPTAFLDSAASLASFQSAGTSNFL